MTTSGNHTDSPAVRQLSIFEVSFDSRIRRVVIDDVTYFSILDVFEYYGKARNSRTSWATALRRLERQGFEGSREILQHKFDGKGQRITPLATFKTFLRISQVTDFTEWEPIRQWMADVANERIEEELNPLLGIRNAERRIEYHKRRYLTAQLNRGETVENALDALPQRIEAVDVFKLLTDEIKLKITNPQYGKVINAEYWSMFHAKADELRKLLSSDSIRDALPPAQLALIKSAELMIREVVKNAEHMTMQDLLDAIDEIVTPMGAILLNASRLAGVHHVTGKPLLTAKVQ